jgi:uncharacterized membrane protein
MNKEETPDESPTSMNYYSATVGVMSPGKVLVESATMIFIISFMLLTMTILLWKGPSLGTGELAAGMLGMILTFTIAVRQYAAFR